MSSKDNISEGFENLLGGINKTLDEQKKKNQTINLSHEHDASLIMRNYTQKIDDNANEDGGTRIFDAIKTDNHDLNDFDDNNISASNSNEFDFLDESSTDELSPAPNDGDYEFQPDFQELEKNDLYNQGLPCQEYTADKSEFAELEAKSNAQAANEEGSSKKKKKKKKNIDSDPNTEDKKPQKKKKKYGVFGSILKFVIYIVFVGVVSAFLAKYIIGVGNDMFAFVKDTYQFGETVYEIKGETDNKFKITETKMSGNKFTFKYEFSRDLTFREKNSLEANISLINANDNSVAYNYGKYRDLIKDGEDVSIDLSASGMSTGKYILRLTVTMENNVSFITEFPVNKKIVNVKISKDDTTEDIAKKLKEKGIIDHPFAFKLYADFKKGRSGSSLGKDYIEGEHQLYPGMDYDDIISALSPKVAVRKVLPPITFREGLTVDEIIDLLIKSGVQNTREEYIEVINNYQNHKDEYQFNYRFIELLDAGELPAGRVYRLEGYLFPDTYEFYSDESPQSVINKFLANFDKKFETLYYDRAAELGLTVDEVLRIASLVEMESGNPNDRYDISSVFHNRLKSSASKDINGLQSDATKDYNSYDFSTKFSIKKDAKSGDFVINLAPYDLEDTDYYFEFTINTGNTRSTATIDFTKTTNDEGKSVFTVKSSKTTDEAITAGVASDLVTKINDVSVSGSVITCEIGFSHAITASDFTAYPRTLNLYRTKYDTYKSPGLMPSAISNPGYASINAALYPSETNYYYFVADNSGKSHFAETLNKHNENIAYIRQYGVIPENETEE